MKAKYSETTAGEIELFDVKFQVNGYFNRRGYVSLKETKSYSVESFWISNHLHDFDGPNILNMIMTFYNAKLAKYLNVWNRGNWTLTLCGIKKILKICFCILKK